MAPVNQFLKVFQGSGKVNLALAILAGLRALLTIVTALLTWLTIWHFSSTPSPSSTPFPFFYGFTFGLIFLTVGVGKAVACSAPTTRLILQLSRWGNPCSGSKHSDDSDVSAVRGPLEGHQLPHHTQLAAPRGPHELHGHSSTAPDSSSSCQLVVKLLKLLAASLALLLLFIVCMVIHGGAVLADLQVMRCYLALNAATTPAARRFAQKQLTEAQQASTECTVALALLFVAPSVAFKWALVMFLGDYSLIPVLSTVISSISYAGVLSKFLSETFMYGSGWTLKERILGTAAVAATVLGQFLWRLAARSFLVMKFGGEVFFFYIILIHLQIAIGVVARPKHSRQAYKDAFIQDRVQTFLLTLHGAALTYDFPTFYQGLKSREAASKPSWLKQLFFSSTALGMLTWRIVEALIIYIIILTVHALPACSNQASPEVVWGQVCAAELARKVYFWRPKCWGCSMFDRYFVLGSMHERQLLVGWMVGAAVLFGLIMMCGLLVLRRLLSERDDLQASVSYTQALPSGPIASIQLSIGPCDSHQILMCNNKGTCYNSSQGDAVVSIPSVTASGHQHGSKAVLECSRKDVESCYNPGPVFQPVEPATVSSGTVGRLPCSSSSMGPINSILAVKATTAAHVGGTLSGQQSSVAVRHSVDASAVSNKELLLRASGKLLLVVVCDVVVFNCHWLVQLVMLGLGILYCLWVHVMFLFKHGDGQAQ